MTDRPSLTIGIEEEYLIVDCESRELIAAQPDAFTAACKDRLGDQVTGEFLQCQIEVGTRPHKTVGGAIEELRSLRDALREICGQFGFAPVAASTHPFSRWRDQTRTDKDRYAGLEQDMGSVVSRMMICGMHIHIGIEDEDLRVDLMNQMTYFLPHLLAMSASSPFWEGRDTGLASYRLTVFDAMPRTGLPDGFSGFAEYRRLIASLVRAGVIEDATMIWWDIRPSDRFPTLEQRITDVCSRLEDAGTIAAAYQSLLAYLWRLKSRNQRWRIYPRTLLMENRWQAQRFGVSGKLIDHGRGELVPFSDLMEEMIDLVGDDAEALGCHRELLGVRRIARDGNSADRQRACIKAATDSGMDEKAACIALVDHLISEF